MKKLLAILVAMVLALSVACVASAETDSQLNAVLEKGELVVGCSPVVEGVCYQDPASGEYVGMIPDLINGYAAELGVSVRWEPLEWSTLIASAERVILLADSTKLKRKSFVRFADLEQIHTLITDKYADPELIAQIIDRGVRVEQV